MSFTSDLTIPLNAKPKIESDRQVDHVATFDKFPEFFQHKLG